MAPADKGGKKRAAFVSEEGTPSRLPEDEKPVRKETAEIGSRLDYDYARANAVQEGIRFEKNDELFSGQTEKQLARQERAQNPLTMETKLHDLQTAQRQRFIARNAYEGAAGPLNQAQAAYDRIKAKDDRNNSGEPKTLGRSFMEAVGIKWSPNRVRRELDAARAELDHQKDAIAPQKRELDRAEHELKVERGLQDASYRRQAYAGTPAQYWDRNTTHRSDGPNAIAASKRFDEHTGPIQAPSEEKGSGHAEL